MYIYNRRDFGQDVIKSHFCFKNQQLKSDTKFGLALDKSDKMRNKTVLLKIRPK